jgi:hypothetical protein
MRKVYIICRKIKGIEYIYHSDDKFYMGYISMGGCVTKVYKSKINAEKCIQRKGLISAYIKEIV